MLNDVKSDERFYIIFSYNFGFVYLPPVCYSYYGIILTDEAKVNFVHLAAKGNNEYQICI